MSVSSFILLILSFFIGILIDQILRRIVQTKSVPKLLLGLPGLMYVFIVLVFDLKENQQLWAAGIFFVLSLVVGIKILKQQDVTLFRKSLWMFVFVIYNSFAHIICVISSVFVALLAVWLKKLVFN